MADPKIDPAAPAAAPKASPLDFLYHKDAVPTGERITLTPEQAKARKRRSYWMALALFTFVILVFVITMTKLGANIMVRDL